MHKDNMVDKESWMKTDSMEGKLAIEITGKTISKASSFLAM